VPQPSYTSPSPSPSAPPAVTVTEADRGRTVRLVTGQELHVALDAPEGEQWQGPSSSAGLYLLEYSEGRDRTTARLQALRASEQPVVLRARTDRACFHSGEPCPQGFTEWSLQVVVEPGPTPSTAYPCYTMAMPSAAPGTVVVTEQDSGERVTVQQGKVVQVYLSGCEDTWTLPAAGSGPLFRSSAAYRANGVSQGTFQALRTGTATITAHTDPACFHVTTPCMRPSRMVSVEVEVVPAGEDRACTVPTTLALDRTTVVATGEAGVTVRAAAGTVVDLLAYTQPSTTYRVVRTATVAPDGTARFALRPPANTRLYAQRRGCAAASEPVVLNVATALSLAAERLGPRQYLFSGDSLPARPGGLVVSLYRVTADGREVLTAQARADAQDGTWSVLRTFTGTGRFGFVARTGQDLQNAPGRSGVRSLLVF